MEHLLAERVKEIMEDQEYSPSGFADTIDVPRPIISHILSGRNKPSLDVIQKILMRFPELNPWWLLTGKGNMKQLNLFSEEELESVSIKPSTPPAVQPLQDTVYADVHVQPPTLAQHHTPSSWPSASTVAEKKEVHAPTAPASNEHTKPGPPPPALMSEGYAQGKSIEKMIVFYTDKSFSVYHPE
jgi:plasmid maintenance system antidote protein VapI